MHRAEERLQILLDVSEMLASTIDYEATLASLPRLLVPRVADCCVIDIMSPDETIRRIGVAFADPAKAALGEQLKRLGPPDPESPTGILRLLEEGRAVLTPEATEADLAAGARDPAHLDVMRAIAPRSSIVVPMRARGRSIGLLWLYTAESGRRYGPDDVALAEDLGRRAALAIDNARLYAEAQAAIRARDIFLTVASHELRSPLTALQIQVHSMRRMAARAASVPGPPPADPTRGSIPPADATRGSSQSHTALHAQLDGRLPDTAPAPRSLEKIAAKIEVAARQVARLTRLVDDLLDVSQIGAGRLKLRLERLDLLALVRDVHARLEGQLAQARCAFELRAEGPVVGLWDRSRLDQVVVNLLSNAMKYGTGAPISVELESTTSTARLCVRDHGIGIAPEDQARIFDRFERAVSERHYAGLGMGLWIVRKIVAAHGGSIRVDSKPGAGAAFTVELPLKLGAAISETKT
ncbi:MAG: GAF domain-containing sensor histidine kinase [Polyangiaceae bacterium]|nr:GAF domain-containing sensor histidine kinase [Polyangiaceae bacterium]